jgi:hypothetical protein
VDTSKISSRLMEAQKSRKFSDEILLDYVKAYNPKYRKDGTEGEMPTIEIKRFEVPTS